MIVVEIFSGKILLGHLGFQRELIYSILLYAFKYYSIIQIVFILLLFKEKGDVLLLIIKWIEPNKSLSPFSLGNTINSK